MPCQPHTGILMSVACLLVAATAGCGNSSMAPVTGHVEYGDGTAATDLAGCLIIFYSAGDQAGGKDVGAYSSRGVIQSDGTFYLSAAADGDGARVGENHISITGPTRRGDTTKTPALELDPKYSNPDTSGLKYTVERGTNRDAKIIIERKKRS